MERNITRSTYQIILIGHPTSHMSLEYMHYIYIYIYIYI